MEPWQCAAKPYDVPKTSADLAMVAQEIQPTRLENTAATVSPAFPLRLLDRSILHLVLRI